jgi:hypothetical protein
MKYLLVVGFSCDVHRREPCARIFIGDKLIDEFYIQHYQNTVETATATATAYDNHVLKPIILSKLLHDIKIKKFPPLRFYEVEMDTTLDRVELRIEIKNSDSNYVNGFMSTSTLIQLQVCHFFPLDEKLLSILVKIRNKNFINKNYAWYHCNKNIIFNLIDNGMRWYGKDQQFNQQFNENLYKNKFNIGGSGHFTCDLVKKYGIFISKLAQSYRYALFGIPNINYFLNKYKQHENQRNTS